MSSNPKTNTVCQDKTHYAIGSWELLQSESHELELVHRTTDAVIQTLLFSDMSLTITPQPWPSNSKTNTVCQKWNVACNRVLRTANSARLPATWVSPTGSLIETQMQLSIHNTLDLKACKRRPLWTEEVVNLLNHFKRNELCHKIIW
jgi:hypothetical protein